MDFINVSDVFQEGIPHGGVSLMMHEWTKNQRYGDYDASTAPTAEHIQATHASAWGKWHSVVPLPDVTDTTNTLSHLDVLQQRRSRRIYSTTPYTITDLAHLLRLINHDADETPHAPYKSLHGWRRHMSLIQPVIIANKIEGLPKGAYRYDAQTNQLYVIRQDDPQPIINYTYYQMEFTHAPLILFLCGSLSQSTTLYGDRGYRYLFLEAGVLLQQCYFASAYLNLSGSTSGSFTQDDFHEWLGFDGYHQTIVTSFVAGHGLSEQAPHE